MLRRPFLALLVVLAAATGCADDAADDTADDPAPSAAATTVGPEHQDAALAVETFLDAVGNGDYAEAYELLTQEAKAGLTLEAFSAAREARRPAARDLATFDIESAAQDGSTVVVRGSGRLADGTPVDLEVPTVQNGDRWEVAQVPTGI